jgi:hypothetical protein
VVMIGDGGVNDGGGCLLVGTLPITATLLFRTSLVDVLKCFCLMMVSVFPLSTRVLFNFRDNIFVHSNMAISKKPDNTKFWQR